MRHIHRPRCRGLFARIVAASLAAVTFWSTGAHGDPADIFAIGAPAIGTDPPKAADIQVGDTSVSTQTGAFEYRYAIEVPPGRGAMQPHLALTYSSQAPIYGGLANGWSLAIPNITLDTSEGRLWMLDIANGPRYVSSMAGGRMLTPISEPAGNDVLLTYRAKNDATFTRYERLVDGGAGPRWRARTPDGNTYNFGDLTHTNGAFRGTSGCTTVYEGNAPLTSEVDAFGNSVDYYYEAGVSGECRLAGVTWGQNANASISDFARVTFNYSILSAPSGCPAGTLVGAQSSYRTGGLIVTGASELDNIVATAYAPGQSGSPVHTRTIALSYSPDDPTVQTASCTSTHAAYRSLYSIHETAVGVDSPLVDLPPVKFTYGSAVFGSGGLVWSAAPQPNPWTVIPAPAPGTNYNLGWGYRFNDATNRWPTVEAMMVDVDGDGLLDRLFNSPYTASDKKYHCRAQWLRNRGNFQFDATPRDIAMPTLKWATSNMSCTNPGRYAGNAFPNADTTRPEEGCALNYQRTDYYNTPPSMVIPCQTQACPLSGYCSDPNAADYGVSCFVTPSAGPTYFAFRWMDADGDGLVDLVASPSMGSVYNLEEGGGLCGDVPPAEPAIFGSWPRTCPTNPYGATPSPGAYTMCGNMYPWMIYKNHGNVTVRGRTQEC